MSDKDEKQETTSDNKTFFVSLYQRKGRFLAHRVSACAPSDKDAPPEDQDTSKTDVEQTPDVHSFSAVFQYFVYSIDMYRNFMPLTLSFAPYLSSSIGENAVGKFTKSKGAIRPDLSNDDLTVYELDSKFYGEFIAHEDEFISALVGAKHLPEVMLIGLISSYDAFLSSLLRVVLSNHQEIIFTTEREIKFSDLLKFSTLDEAKGSLIDREIDGVMRKSHHEQFQWMEKQFSMKLRENLAVWPRFIEVCERRNLLTHTGGVVSNQYVSNCKEHKIKLPKDAKLGSKLGVNPDYYHQAVEAVYEIGVKLCYVF